MRLLVQSVSQASVLIHDIQETRRIDEGILIYFGVHKNDLLTYKDTITKIVSKIWSMRRLKNDMWRLDATLQDINGCIMVISNFTLYAHNDKGTKMSFSDSAPADEAVIVYNTFVQALRDVWFVVQTGEFGALMEVHATTVWPINYIWDL